ncbi:MAG: polymer-forming cytoskeletal protein [Bacillota bacterium]|nr:polymer-forming cytoskeletal protein [Bacillota bacterium]
MFKNKKNFETKKVDTLIGKETSMKGQLEAKGIIRIEGAFEGEIFTASDVIIGENADVKGDVNCYNATLAGRVEGNVNVQNKLDIRANGILIGDIKAVVLSIEDGAYFSGNSKMEKKDKKNERVQLKTSEITVNTENKGVQEKENKKDYKGEENKNTAKNDVKQKR